MLKRRIAVFLMLVTLTGCAGIQRGCSSMWATDVGADWIVVQYAANGEPINCWKLRDVGITNETNSDGIYWREGSGHLVHISGWYNRIQVSAGDFRQSQD